MSKKISVKRNIPTLIQRLIGHLEILIELSDKAFYEHKHEKYLGEVAGKLRVLVIETRTNKPLLIDLMNHFEYERVWDGNVPGMRFTLRTYMYMLAIYAKGGCEFSHEKVIRYLSQQSGGSHEDWELDSELHYLLYEDRARSCDSPYINRIIRTIVNVVAEEATLFLLYLHKNNTLKELGINYNLRQILNIHTHYDHSLDWNLKSRKDKGIEDRVKPTKSTLQEYDILCLAGKNESISFRIPGITPQDEFRKNGPKNDYWMEKVKGLYRMKES